MTGSAIISKVRLQIKLWLKTILSVPGFLMRTRPPHVRVLFYHRVNPYAFAELGAVSRELTVNPEMFDAQLAYLKRNGYRTLNLDGFERMMKGMDQTDPKAVLITFDDGYEDNLVWAAPLLNKHGFSAVAFIVSDFVGKSTTQVWPDSDPEGLGRFLDADQIAQWKTAGLEIGSHTKTHPLLTSLPAQEQMLELEASRTALEQKFGVPVKSLAYPGGDFDDATARHAQNAGYAIAFSTILGVNMPGDPMWSLRRTEVSASDNMLVFRAKMSGLLDWLAFKESSWFRRFIGRVNRMLIPFAQATRPANE